MAQRTEASRSQRPNSSNPPVKITSCDSGATERTIEARGSFVQPPLQAVEFEQPPFVVAGIERSRIVFGHRPVLVGRPIIGRQQVDNAGTGGTRGHRRKHSGQETKQAVQELDRHKSLHGLGDKNRPFLRNIQTFARRNARSEPDFSHDRSSLHLRTKR